jgi:hypothetical protein
LREGELFRACSPHQPREAVVSFDASGLVIKSVLLIALPGELLLDGPWRAHTVGSSMVTTYSSEVGILYVQGTTVQPQAHRPDTLRPQSDGEDRQFGGTTREETD